MVHSDFRSRRKGLERNILFPTETMVGRFLLPCKRSALQMEHTPSRCSAPVFGPVPSSRSHSYSTLTHTDVVFSGQCNILKHESHRRHNSFVDMLRAKRLVKQIRLPADPPRMLTSPGTDNAQEFASTNSIRERNSLAILQQRSLSSDFSEHLGELDFQKTLHWMKLKHLAPNPRSNLQLLLSNLFSKAEIRASTIVIQQDHEGMVFAMMPCRGTERLQLAIEIATNLGLRYEICLKPFL